MYIPLPNYVHIHSLVSVNIQQVLMNVNMFIFFRISEVNDILPMRREHFHLKQPLPDGYQKQSKNGCFIGSELHHLLVY